MQNFEAISCTHGDKLLEGFVARPSGDGPFPTVIVMHSANGLRHQVRGAAERLVALGYLAIATDMYGPEIQAVGPPGTDKAYVGFEENPALLRERIVTWFDAIVARSDVDRSRMAAIGYCFGGKCVLELARSGADLKAVVSYHGILTTHAPARPGDVKCEVMAYCGALDPYAPLDTVDALQKEMIAAGARYHVTTFGEAAHSFTDPDAGKMGMPGIAYHPLADKLSWAGTIALLEAEFR